MLQSFMIMVCISIRHAFKVFIWSKLVKELGLEKPQKVTVSLVYVNISIQFQVSSKCSPSDRYLLAWRSTFTLEWLKNWSINSQITNLNIGPFGSTNFSYVSLNYVICFVNFVCEEWLYTEDSFVEVCIEMPKWFYVEAFE